MEASCMRCGRIHKKYRFKRGQLCYLLWCENCGTQMHEPIESLLTKFCARLLEGLRNLPARFREIQKYFCLLRAGKNNRWAALAHGVLKMEKCICNLEDGIHEWDCPAVKDSHFYREEPQEILDRMAPFFGLEKKQEAHGVRWAEKQASLKSRPTPRAADSPSGYSVKPSMPKGYKFVMVNCPNCQRPVKENWLVKHIKSGCKIPVTKNTASR